MFGTVIGATAALTMMPLLLPDATDQSGVALAAVDGGIPDALPPSPPDAGPVDAGRPRVTDAIRRGRGQVPYLIASAEEVRWAPQRGYPAFDKRAAVRAAHRAAAGISARCELKQVEERASVVIAFGPSGIAVRTAVVGALRHSPRRACVEQLLEAARVEPFAGRTREVRVNVAFE